MKVVIVGGVAGGATAAARIRRLDEQAEIIVFERSGYISYANCGLPYYIGGVIEDPEELTLQTPESFFSRFRVTMKVRHEVTAIHPEKKTVSVRNLENGQEFEESYDNCCFRQEPDRCSPGYPVWEWKVYSHCGQWKILSVSMNIYRRTSPSRWCWREADLSVWNWRRI